MNGDSPWTVLGVEPDVDEDALRAAYATRLKQTNPEDDAEGFKRLRLAYEHAIRIVRRRIGLVFTDDSLDEQGNEEILVREHTSPQADLRDDDAVRTWAGEAQAHLLLRTRLSEALLSDVKPEVLTNLLDAVLKAPAMDRIDIFEDTQRWLVHLAYEARPRSYPLVDPIITYFGWKLGPEKLGEWQGPRVMFELREDLRIGIRTKAMIRRLEDSRHEFHRAFSLTKPSASPVPRRTRLAKLWALRHINLVERFLANVERSHRSVLQYLDEQTIEWWKRQLSIESLPYTILRNARPIAMALGVIAAIYVAGHVGGTG